MGAFNDTFRLALDAAVTNKVDTVTLETEAALVASTDASEPLWLAANPTWKTDLATLAASTIATKAATVKSKLEEAAGEL